MHLRSQQRVVAALFLATNFITIMDSTIVNVALPTLARSFDVASTSANGVIVDYMVAMAIAMPVAGWLGDRGGNERVFLSAVVVFLIASVLCALSSSLTALELFRCLQGLGAGLMLPVSMTMLYRRVAEADRLQVNRLLMIPLIIAPASAPMIGGFLVEQLSWHWIFWVNVPICALAVGVGAWLLESTERHAVGRFDLPGFALVAVGMALVMYALNEGSDSGWGAASVWAPGVVGVIGIAAFTRYQSRAHSPILDLRVLRRLQVRDAMTVMVSANASFAVVLYAAPLMLQDARGYSPWHSGLTTFAEAIGVGVGTQLGSRVLHRVGSRTVVSLGLGIAGAGAVLLAALSGTAQSVVIWALIFTVGFGMAGEMVPTQIVAFAGLDARETAAASVVYNVGGRLAAAVGIALVSAVMVAVAGGHDPEATIAPYRWAFAVAAVFAMMGSLAAKRLPGAEITTEKLVHS